MPKPLTKEEILQRFHNTHGYDKFSYDLFDKYENIKQKVPVICLTCNKVFYQYIDDHFRGHGCPYCSGRIVTTKDFIEKAKKTHGDKYGYDQTEYIDSDTKVKIFCKKCNDYFWQLPYVHVAGCGCRRCGIERQKTKSILGNKTFIERAKKIHGDKYRYDDVEYKNAYEPVKIYCKKCKQYFYQKPVVHVNARCGCPKCSSSKGEQQIAMFLSSHNIAFERQYKFMDCRDKRVLPFDFYLPDYNMCIEYQGFQHYDQGIYNRLTGTKEKGRKRFLDIQKHDKIKQNYCTEHNIKFLEIRYDEDVEEKLKGNLQI